MRRSQAVKLIILMAFLAAVGPLLAAVFLAQRQSLEAELERVTAYARMVVDRSDRAVEQMLDAIAILSGEHAATGGDACSPTMLALMRELGVTMEFMKVAGFVQNERMTCSTLGIHDEGLDIGPVDVVTANGTRLRYSAPVVRTDEDAPVSLHATTADVPYVSLELDSFIAMAPRTQALDLVVDQEGVLFATFDATTSEIRTSNGAINKDWVTGTAGSTEAAFVADDYIIGVVRSDRVQFTGAIAAVPVRYLNAAVYEFVLLLLPIALVAGAGLSASFIYLARQQSSSLPR